MRIMPALAVVVAGSPAFSERLDWGTLSSRSSVTFDGRIVTFCNEMTPRDPTDPHGPLPLSSGDLTITISVIQWPGRAPDLLTVIPPLGWLAVPASITVEEGACGTILIEPLALS